MIGKIREPQWIEKSIDGSIYCNDVYVRHSDPEYREKSLIYAWEILRFPQYCGTVSSSL
jgi:hypothetical protein